MVPPGVLLVVEPLAVPLEAFDTLRADLEPPVRASLPKMPAPLLANAAVPSWRVSAEVCTGVAVEVAPTLGGDGMHMLSGDPSVGTR